MESKHIASALVKVLSVETVAEIIDSLLCCSDDERLTDDETENGADLFESLCELSPEAMEFAQTGCNPEMRKPCCECGMAGNLVTVGNLDGNAWHVVSVAELVKSKVVNSDDFYGEYVCEECYETALANGAGAPAICKSDASAIVDWTDYL